MKARLLATAIAACSLSFAAPAQNPPDRLDLSVPQTATSQPATAFPSRAADPPGTYYGDTSGRIASADAADDVASRPIDDGKARISGSVSTGIGYSRGYGNSHWNAADINLRKSFGEDGNKTFNMNISVNKMDGPGYYGGGRYGRPLRAEDADPDAMPFPRP